MVSSRRLRVTVLMHRWVGYLHGVQLGIAEYVMQKPQWICNHLLPDAEGLASLRRSPVDGVITYLEPDYLGDLQSLGIPVVNVSNWRDQGTFPCVLPDDVAVGRLAGQYLLDLGLKRFAYRGYPGVAFSSLRLRGFQAVLAAAGYNVSLWSADLPAPPELEPVPGMNRSTLMWLRDLPKPAAVFCCNDVAACEILDHCRFAEIRVPEEICILGVDNDELLTRISQPPISSISLHTQKVGFEAARLLDRLMQGQPAPEGAMLFPPVGVVSRQSTNLLAIDDEYVLAALHYIREHVHEQTSVDDVLRVVPVNRRFLERRFKEQLNRSPLQEIRRVRIETAKQLLSGTDLAMPAIARRSGFPNPERLANVFHDEVGMTPTQYRRTFRLHDV